MLYSVSTIIIDHMLQLFQLLHLFQLFQLFCEEDTGASFPIILPVGRVPAAERAADVRPWKEKECASDGKGSRKESEDGRCSVACAD